MGSSQEEPPRVVVEMKRHFSHLDKLDREAIAIRSDVNELRDSVNYLIVSVAELRDLDTGFRSLDAT